MDDPTSPAAEPAAPRAAVPLSLRWDFRGNTLALDRPRILGILNVTPDSFSDGGRYAAPDAAVRHAEVLMDEGADVIDVGGESTRPGAAPISAAEELQRVVPIVWELVRRWPHVPVSVDTTKALVARAVLDEGACIINDVSGLRLEPALGPEIARAGAGVVLMHSRGGVAEMAGYAYATYGSDPAAEVAGELSGALRRARDAGIPEPAIVVDPGLGFSKRTEHSAAVVARLDRILELGRPVLVGPSRKRLVRDLGGGDAVSERLHGTIGACVAALARGARLFRVHDVRAVREALTVADSILRAS